MTTTKRRTVPLKDVEALFDAALDALNTGRLSRNLVADAKTGMVSSVASNLEDALVRVGDRLGYTKRTGERVAREEGR